MHILILNWRDPKNPKAGGAEKLNLHILRPLIKRGDKITWYARECKGLKSREKYEGIQIIRSGNILLHFLQLPFLFWGKKFGKVDFIIDCIHGTGYMSNILTPRTKKVILICEVAKDIWDEMYPFPINSMGKIWEKIMFKIYKGSQFWTISHSTKSDLIKSGISARSIKVLPMGFDGIKLKTLPVKYSSPTALFVGRLAKMKGVEDAIHAMSQTSSWKLEIIGRGDKEYERTLKRLVSDLRLKGRVTFLGYVPEREKFAQMAKAWVLVVPSLREGWGMIVPEANSVGTKVIGYKVPGLVDSLKRSPDNSSINTDVDSIVHELNKSKKPTFLKNKPVPGWDELYRFIEKEV